jgi:hypothetical protein
MEVKEGSILRKASLSPYEEIHVEEHGDDHRHGDQQRPPLRQIYPAKENA